MKKCRYLFMPFLCLFLFACNVSSPLAGIEGKWNISIDETIKANPSLQGNTTADSLSKTIAVTLLDGMALSFDTKNKKVSGKFLGMELDNQTFGVVEEKEGSVTILVMTMQLKLTPKGDSLEVRRNDDTKTLIFSKVK